MVENAYCEITGIDFYETGSRSCVCVFPKWRIYFVYLIIKNVQLFLRLPENYCRFKSDTQSILVWLGIIWLDSLYFLYLSFTGVPFSIDFFNLFFISFFSNDISRLLFILLWRWTYFFLFVVIYFKCSLILNNTSYEQPIIGLLSLSIHARVLFFIMTKVLGYFFFILVFFYFVFFLIFLLGAYTSTSFMISLSRSPIIRLWMYFSLSKCTISRFDYLPWYSYKLVWIHFWYDEVQLLRWLSEFWLFCYVLNLFLRGTVRIGFYFYSFFTPWILEKSWSLLCWVSSSCEQSTFCILSRNC